MKQNFVFIAIRQSAHLAFPLLRQTAKTNMNCVCPKCNSEQIQRFPVVYDGGVSDATSQSTGIGVGMAGGRLGVGFGGSATHSVSVSRLAQRLAPPARQSGPPMFLIVPCFFLWWVPHIGPLLLVMGTLLLVYFRNQALKWNRHEWPRLMQEWENSWLCHKCGNQFQLT